MGSANAEPITCAYKELKNVSNVDATFIFEESENEINNSFVKDLNQWTETGFYTHPLEAKIEFKGKEYECKFNSARYINPRNGAVTYDLDGNIKCGPFKFTNSVFGRKDTTFDFTEGSQSDHNLRHPHWAKWATYETEKKSADENIQKYLILNVNNPTPYVNGKMLNYKLAPNLDRCILKKRLPTNGNRDGYMCIEKVICENGVSKTIVSQDILLIHPRIAKVLSKLFSDKANIYVENSGRTWKQGNDGMKAHLHRHQKGFDNPHNLVLKFTVTSKAPYRVEIIESPL